MLPGPRHRGSLPCGRYLLALLIGNKEESKSLHQLGPQPTFFMPRWTTHFCILYQVCATRGAVVVVVVLVDLNTSKAKLRGAKHQIEKTR